MFVVTIALFPATVSLIHSVDNPDGTFDSQLSWIGNLFSPLVCFLLFNASDYVGRTLTIWFTFVSGNGRGEREGRKGGRRGCVGLWLVIGEERGR